MLKYVSLESLPWLLLENWQTPFLYCVSILTIKICVVLYWYIKSKPFILINNPDQIPKHYVGHVLPHLVADEPPPNGNPVVAGGTQETVSGGYIKSKPFILINDPDQIPKRYVGHVLPRVVEDERPPNGNPVVAGGTQEMVSGGRPASLPACRGGARPRRQRCSRCSVLARALINSWAARCSAMGGT